MYSIDKLTRNNITFDIINLKQKDLELTVTNYGCTILELNTKNKDGIFENVVMTYLNIESLIDNEMYINSVVGPTAGRIKNATYTLNNQTYHLDKNFFETENLHAGKECFSFQLFDYEITDDEIASSIIFSYKKPNKNSSYPGEVELKVIYTIKDNDFTIEYIGTTSETTLLNLTNHAYFNLSGNMKRNVLNHKVFLNASNVMTLDNKNVPIGVEEVTNTYLDFRKNKPLKKHYFDGIYDTLTGGIDHPFMFDHQSMNQLNASLYDPKSKRLMEVYTTYPCVVVYAHNFPDNEQLAYHVKTQKHLGICFETQNPPNGINIDNMESSILEPNEQYNHKTIYRFMVKEG